MELIDACVGIRYTYVITKCGGRKFIGLAFTPLEDLTLHYEIPSKLNLEELPNYIGSTNMLLKTLGIAAINSISQYILDTEKGCSNYEFIPNKDLCDVINIDSNDRVVVIGYIGPIINRLKKLSRYVYVLERSLSRRHDALPEVLAPRVVSNADVVIITGSTLINDTIDNILSLSRNARLRAIVGATAQVYPEALFKYTNIDVIASFIPRNEESIDVIARLVRLGGGTKEIYRYGTKYVVLRK